MTSPSSVYSVASVITNLAPAHFAELNLLAQKYGFSGVGPTVFQLFYKDQINQALGRNQGYRRDYGALKTHTVYLNKNLYNQLGPDFFSQGRYPMYLDKA
jgi:hypothetical protein